MSAAICGPAMHEIFRQADGVRWCFNCRKHTQFFRIILDTIEPSYYDPNQSIRCDNCRMIDGDLFPGRSREWVE